jgi:polyisoprenoid-binding protein YceI
MLKDACGANATTKIKLSDFAMGKRIPFVSDDGVVTIPVEAVKK